jgi:microsomal dipeptidase-like Zn-dependent dipeptidase
MEEIKQKAREKIKNLCNSLGVDHLNTCSCDWTKGQECNCVSGIEKITNLFDSLLSQALQKRDEEWKKVIDSSEENLDPEWFFKQVSTLTIK